MIKKYFFITSCFLYLVICSALIVSKAWTEEAGRVEITYLSGETEVLLKGCQDYVAVEEGMMLESGDKVKTGSAAALELSFNEDDSNLVRLGSDTSAEISLSGDEKLFLTEGEIFASVARLSSGAAFEIRTPTAISGARGTDWVTRVSQEETDVEAIDQSPYVRHFEKEGVISRQEILIRPGEMTTVKKFQRPQAARTIMNARLESLKAVKKILQLNIIEAQIKRKQRPAFDRSQFLQKIKRQINGLQLEKPGAVGLDSGKIKPMGKPWERKGKDVKEWPGRKFLPW
jgi:hypothetical protein